MDLRSVESLCVQQVVAYLTPTLWETVTVTAPGRQPHLSCNVYASFSDVVCVCVRVCTLVPKWTVAQCTPKHAGNQSGMLPSCVVVLSTEAPSCERGTHAATGLQVSTGCI